MYVIAARTFATDGKIDAMRCTTVADAIGSRISVTVVKISAITAKTFVIGERMSAIG